MAEMTYTWVPSDIHDAVKAFAAINRIKLPEAYSRIVVEGLKAFNYDIEKVKK